MFEESFYQRVKKMQTLVREDTFLETRDMGRDKAYIDCRHTFYRLADSIEDYKSYERPSLYVFSALCAAGLATLLAVVLVKNQTTMGKIFIGAFVFILTMLFAFILREIYLDSIAKKIARCYERIDSHELNRPRMVAKLRKEFENSLVDPHVLHEPDYEAMEDEEEDSEILFTDCDDDETRFAKPVEEDSDETAEDSDDESDKPEPDKLTKEKASGEDVDSSPDEKEVEPDSIKKLIRDLDAFLASTSR